MGFKVITGEAAVTPSEVLAVSFTAEKSRGHRAPPSPVKERGDLGLSVRAAQKLSRLDLCCHVFLRVNGISSNQRSSESTAQTITLMGRPQAGPGLKMGSMHTCVCNTPIRSHMYTLAQACKEHTPEHTQTCTHRPVNPLAREWRGACTCTHTYMHTQLTHMQAHTCTHIHAA